MVRRRKEDSSYKANLSLTKLELLRLHEMASTWGMTPSRMVALLINQVYESKAFLNGYDDLSEEERQELLKRRAHLANLREARRESTYKRNFERLHGSERGLTNVMLVLAPKHDSGVGKTGINIPGVFCERLGQVWVVPYGLLSKISPVEIMAYPCYASVSDFLSDTRIAPNYLQTFINTNKDYVIMSESEYNILSKLYEDNGSKLGKIPVSAKVTRDMQQRQLSELMMQNPDLANQYIEIIKELSQGDFSRMEELPEFLRPSDNSIDAVSAFQHTPESYTALKEYMLTKHKQEQKQRLASSIDDADADDDSQDYINALKEKLVSLDDRIETDRIAATDKYVRELARRNAPKTFGPNIFSHAGLDLFATQQQSQSFNGETVQPSANAQDKQLSEAYSPQQAAFSTINAQLQANEDDQLGSSQVSNKLDEFIKVTEASRQSVSQGGPVGDDHAELERRKSRAEEIKRRLGLILGEDEATAAQDDKAEVDRLLNLKPKPCYTKTPKTVIVGRSKTGEPKKRTSKKTSELDALISDSED